MSEGEVQITPFTLGTLVIKFQMPMQMVDEINNTYENAKDLPAFNSELAGKIENEFKVTDVLSDNIKQFYVMCWREYTQRIQKPWWHCVPDNAWINDMKANEYNPFHIHSSSRKENPSNGWLEFCGGQQDPLSISQLRVDAQIGDLYIFPYTLLHGVYPFNGTDEIRRTLSYNCNLFRDALINKGNS